MTQDQDVETKKIFTRVSKNANTPVIDDIAQVLIEQQSNVVNEINQSIDKGHTDTKQGV